MIFSIHQCFRLSWLRVKSIRFGLMVLLLLLLVLASDHHAALAQGSTGPNNTPGSNSGAANPADMYNTMMYSCWVCPISAMMVDVAYEMGQAMFDFLGGNVRRLIAIIIALWVLLQAGKLLMPFGALDSVGGMANKIAARLAITLLVLTALDVRFGFNFFNDYFFTPAISVGMRGGHAMLEAVFGGSDPMIVLQAPYDQFNPLRKPLRTVKSGSGTTTEAVVGPEGQVLECGNIRFDGSTKDEKKANVKNALNCQFYALQRAVGVGIVAGISSMQKIQWTLPPKGWDWLLAGFVMTLIYGLGALLVGLFMITYLFRWLFIAVIAPLAIAAYALPIGRAPLKICISGLIHSAIGFIMINALIAISIAMLSVGFTQSLGSKPGSSAPTDGGAVVTDIIAGPLSGQGNSNSFAAPGYWIMLTAGIVLIMFARRIDDWAGQYVQGSFTVDIGKEMAEEAVSKGKMGAAGAFGMLKKI
jgi:hypothetical protein